MLIFVCLRLTFTLDILVHTIIYVLDAFIRVRLFQQIFSVSFLYVHCTDDIPPNSTLIFNTILLDVWNDSDKVKVR